MSPSRAAIIVSAFAATSRILGFIRDILLTQFLGAGPVADAFLAAFRFPNALRRIISEGGFNPVFIPFYLTIKAEGNDNARLFARKVCLAWGGVLVLITALAEVAAAPLMRLLAGGLESGTLSLSIFYFRLLFPLVLGSGIAALLSAVLNAEKRVIATSIAPLTCNMAIIIAVMAITITDIDPTRSGTWIAAAAGFSGFIHLVIIGFATYRSHLIRRKEVAPNPELSHHFRRFLRTVLPAFIAISTTQFFALVAAQVASNIPSAISWFYYADRLFQLPAGFIAAASGIVLLPQIARHNARNDKRASMLAQNRALESALLIALPASLALCVLALPITSVLFQRGAFQNYDSIKTAEMLFILAVSLPFAVTGKIFINTLFAFGKINSAIVSGLIGLSATWLFAIGATNLLGANGVAYGAAGGIILHSLLLAGILTIGGLWRPDLRLFKRGLAIIISSALMVLLLLACNRFIGAYNLLGLALHCLIGVVVYGAAAWLTGAISSRDIKRYMRH